MGLAARGREAAALADRRPRARSERAGQRSRRPIGYSVQAPGEELRRRSGRRRSPGGGCCSSAVRRRPPLRLRGARRPEHAPRSRGGRRRLTWYGARRWQLRLLTLTESAIVAVAAPRRLARRHRGRCAGGRAAGAPVGAVLRESVLAAVRARARRRRGGRSRRWSWRSRPRSRPVPRPFGLLDIAASARSRSWSPRCSAGPPTSRGLRRARDAGLVLLLLPGLIAFAAAVPAARLFGPFFVRGATLPS